MKGPRNLPALLLCLLFGATLLATLWQLPGNAGLGQTVERHLPESGVTHGVTAVLLNFRGYDTLFEVGVLLLALISVWSLAEPAPPPAPIAGRVQTAFLRFAGPLLILLAGYLLWIGSRAPGGAFQAGAILAGVGVLLQESGRSPGDGRSQYPFRLALAGGFLVFTLIAFALPLLGDGKALLEYPAGQAGGWILVIEAAGMISIGLVLAELYRGRGPDQPVSEKHPHHP